MKITWSKKDSIYKVEIIDYLEQQSINGKAEHYIKFKKYYTSGRETIVCMNVSELLDKYFALKNKYNDQSLILQQINKYREMYKKERDIWMKSTLKNG